MEKVFDKVYQQWVPKNKAVAPISNCVNKKTTKGSSKAPQSRK